MSDDTISPASRLAAARKAAGLTQRQLAEKAGVSPGRINHLETGRKRLTLDEAWRLAGVIGCKPSEIDPRLTDRKGE